MSQKRLSSGVSCRWLRFGVVMGLMVGVVASGIAAAAGGVFTDDDGSIFESDIEWLATAGVTKGCNPPDNTRFCPDDDVTRGQMAAFLRRFAQFLGAEDGVVDRAQDAATLGGKAPNEFIGPEGPRGLRGEPGAEGPPGPLGGSWVVDDATHGLTIPAAAFTSDGMAEPQDFLFPFAGGQLQVTTESSRGRCFVAPVLLPQGAAPLQLRAVVVDDRTDGEVIVSFYEKGLTGTAHQRSPLLGSGYPEAVPGYRTISKSTYEMIIDNTSNAYYLGVCIDQGTAFTGAQIVYTP